MEALVVALTVVLVSSLIAGMLFDEAFLSRLYQRSTSRARRFFALERPWHRAGALLCIGGIALMAVEIMFFETYSWRGFWREVSRDRSPGLLFYGFWAFASGAALWWLIEPALFPLIRWIFTGRK